MQTYRESGKIRRGEAGTPGHCEGVDKLATQADAYKACEPQAPGQAVDFLSVFRRTAFLKNG